MDLNHLTTFCTVVEAGSISKAAKELYVTQPAISQKIQELEEHYKAQLLDRTNRGIQPTEIGLYVYSEAQKIQAMMANIKREIEALRNPTEELWIGASTTIGNFALPCTMFVFREKYPDYKANIEIGNATEIIEKLISRRVELGMVEGPVGKDWKDRLASEDVACHAIAQTRMILVAESSGHFKDLKSIDLDELTNIPLLVREKGSGIRATIELTLAEEGYDLNNFSQLFELNTTSAIISAVTSGLGATLLPTMALRKELRHKILKPIKVENVQFKHDINLLYQENSMKQSYNAFVDLVSNPQERGFC